MDVDGSTEAVKRFQPYDRVREKNDEARAAGAKLIAAGAASAGKKRTFIYVNNRLVGNALETIAAMLEDPVWIILKFRPTAIPIVL